MTSFVLLLTAIGTPWAVITLIGFVRCGGVYDADALQVRGAVYLLLATRREGARGTARPATTAPQSPDAPSRHVEPRA